MDKKLNEFQQIGTLHGTDKVTHHGYHYFYPTHLDFLKNEKFNLLEIGFEYGKSARLWKDYFKNAKIFSMDINTSNEIDEITVLKGDQGKRADLEEVARIIKVASVIVDDASHHPIHQIETFNFLFRNLLAPGGVYIIEDIECSYWHESSSLYGYQIGIFNAVEFTKKFVEYINSEFSGKENVLFISSITYGQNCIIIRKQTEDEMAYFNRSYRYLNNLAKNYADTLKK